MAHRIADINTRLKVLGGRIQAGMRNARIIFVLTVALPATLAPGSSAAGQDSLTCDRDYLVSRPDNASALHENFFKLFPSPQAENSFSKQATQCLVPVSEATDGRNRKQLLVDVRDRQRYNDGHIPGAINISEDLLDSKLF